MYLTSMQPNIAICEIVISIRYITRIKSVMPQFIKNNPGTYKNSKTNTFGFKTRHKYLIIFKYLPSHALAMY